MTSRHVLPSVPLTPEDISILLHVEREFASLTPPALTWITSPLRINSTHVAVGDELIMRLCRSYGDATRMAVNQIRMDPTHYSLGCMLNLCRQQIAAFQRYMADVLSTAQGYIRHDAALLQIIRDTGEYRGWQVYKSLKPNHAAGVMCAGWTGENRRGCICSTPDLPDLLEVIDETIANGGGA